LGALEAIHPDSERLAELDQKKRDDQPSADEYDELMRMSENALVHRDIKPQNIMLTRNGAKLLDFNIASRVGDPVRTVSGTPPYQPPDADLTRWDVSTDLFAVGVTLYDSAIATTHTKLGAPWPTANPVIRASSGMTCPLRSPSSSFERAMRTAPAGSTRPSR